MANTFIHKYGVAILSLIFFSFYILGILFPDLWWTTHWLAFLPPFWKYFFLIVSAFFMLSPWIWPKGFTFSQNRFQQFTEQKGKWIIGIITLLSAILMYNFPIKHDYYGDSYKIIQHLGETISSIPEGTNDAFFRFGLSPWDGHSTILAIVTYIAYFTGITYGKAFLWLDLICGTLFVFVWLTFVRYYLSHAVWRFIMGIAGITAPFMLIYFGHIESYAPVFLSFMGWLALAMVYIRNQKTSLLWWLIPVLLVCIKLHPVALLFFPAWLLLFLGHYSSKIPFSSKLTTWRGIAIWFLIPIFSAGAILYFFVFKDYNDPRHLNDMAMEYDRLFLPILSPDPPLEKYNLLSFNHIFDYFSEILLWSPIALFTLLILLLNPFKNAWNRMPVKVAGLTLILFGSLFFMINPLLSMPIDWDLMAIPAVVFLVFVLVLVEESSDLPLGNRVLPVCLGLMSLSLSTFMVHSNVQAHSERLESVGVRMYHSYYEWSRRVIQFALDMPTYASRQEYEGRKQAILTKLKPFAQEEVDFEYARLLISEGKYFLRVEKDYPRSLQVLKEAEFHYPMEKNGLLYLMEVNFLLKQYQEAFAYSEKLIQIQYPDEKKSLTIATQCALEANLFPEAMDISGFFVKKWGAEENPIITEVYQRLQSGDKIDELKYLFARQE